MRIDSAELIDSGEVATILGLSSSTAVSTYRARYPSFPPPLVTKGSGKCVLWLKRDIERWAASDRR